MHSEEWKQNWKRPVIHHNMMTQWGWMVSYPENLMFEDYLDVGAFTYINAKNHVIIGKNVEIGSHCAIISESSIDGKKGQIIIGNNVCIGTHSTIMPGVIIGNNAVIGAHSFVKKSVSPDQVAFGVPSRLKEEPKKKGCSCGH